MDSFPSKQIYNSKEVIELYEKITGLEYLIPEAFYHFYGIEIFRYKRSSGIIKKSTTIKVYESYLCLAEEEKEKFINYEEKLADFYQRKVYRIGEDFIKSFNYMRITDEICKVIKKNLKKEVCFNCWLRQHMCICHKIKKVQLLHKIYLIFHYSEILKPSNTGKLLKIMDNNTEMLIFGIPEYENKIKELFSDNNFVQNSVCLFPSKDSILASEYYQKIREDLIKKERLNLNETNEADAIAEKFENLEIKNLNVFVIDGTWPQAISMMQIVPQEMIKLKIIAQAKNVYNSLRYRYSEETCSTIEAVATLLTNLGEKEANIKEIYNALIMLVDKNLERKKTPQEEQIHLDSKNQHFNGFTENDFA